MHIQFAELPVFDQDRARSFYVEHFGCLVAADQPMEPNGWRWIELQFEDPKRLCISFGVRMRFLLHNPFLCWWTRMWKAPLPRSSPKA